MAVDLVVSLVVAAGDAELASDRLWGAGATGVEERPAGHGRVELVAGFPTAPAARSAAGALGAVVVEVDDGAWRDAWRPYARAVCTGSMTVAPAWRPVATGPPGEGSGLVLSIDPGACFGSGSHPTTRLMLAALQPRVAGGMAVLDAGTGSGVLAVAAAALGAERVIAIDTDPAAIEATRRNATANGVAGRVVASLAEVATVTGTFDVVVANLTARTLAEHAGVLVGAVAPGGVLLVSGMLSGQWQHVAASLSALPVAEVLDLDGWCGAVLGPRR